MVIPLSKGGETMFRKQETFTISEFLQRTENKEQKKLMNDIDFFLQSYLKEVKLAKPKQKKRYKDLLMRDFVHIVIGSRICYSRIRPISTNNHSNRSRVLNSNHSTDLSRASSRVGNNLSNVGRGSKDCRTRRKSEIMVHRDSERNTSGSFGSSSNLAVNHNRKRDSKSITRLPKFLDHLSLNKGKVIPLSAMIIPSLFLTGCSFDMTTQSFSLLTESFQSISTFLETINAASKEDLLHPQNHMYTLMVWIFKTVSRIIYTPVFLFDNEFFHHLIRIFTGISIGVVTIGSMVEGFKRVLGFSGSSFKRIILRLPIMIAICGFAPFGFIKAIEAMNGITNLNFYDWHQYALQLQVNLIWGHLVYLVMILESLGFILFILLYIALLIPMMLNHGKRWFSLIALGILTPFAMLGYVFDSFKSFTILGGLR